MKSDQVYVTFDQKSIAQQYRPSSDYIKVEKSITAYTGGKQNIAVSEIFVKTSGYALTQSTEHFLSGYDAINVLNDGNSFALEFSLDEVPPREKFPRVVETTFSPNLSWS